MCIRLRKHRFRCKLKKKFDIFSFVFCHANVYEIFNVNNKIKILTKNFDFSDVIFSAIGALLWAIGLAVWITIYQTNRVAWGEFADDISFIIPLGTA